MTTESLPPENSITGEANVAATSRRMWIDSDSRACNSVSGRNTVGLGHAGLLVSS